MEGNVYGIRRRTPLTGILLLAHAPLASAYAKVAADMGVPAPTLMALDMPTDMSREDAVATAKMLLADHALNECLVLVDLGCIASPYAVAQTLRALPGLRCRIVAGLNTAMLITALCHCRLSVDELAARVTQRALDAIKEPPAV